MGRRVDTGKILAMATAFTWIGVVEAHEGFAMTRKGRDAIAAYTSRESPVAPQDRPGPGGLGVIVARRSDCCGVNQESLF
jgi:hypothetical protein